MRFIRELSPETRKLLGRIIKESKSRKARARARCIVLSFEGCSIEKLTVIFAVERKTIYNWFTRWEDQGLLGLYDRKGRGRKPTFNEEQGEEIKEWVKTEPKNLKKVLEKVNKDWGIKTSKDTIKRVLKKLEMRWKRLRRGIAKKPDEWELEVKLPLLKELKKQEERGEIDIRYFDESGLTLVPYVPYGWQEKGERIKLKSCLSKRANILGAMNRQNELYYEIHIGKIDSEVVISFLDNLANHIKKTTIVLMDQASIHTSDKVLAKLPEWEDKNLEIFWLPTYSPHLNLIEILWKFIKYEWIEIEAYEDWKSLLNYLQKVLSAFGEEYIINFA
jgi:transposase